MSSRSYDKVATLRRRGITYRETNSGELNFHCPFCSDNRWRFFWNKYTGKAYCHNCEFQGSIFGFLSKFLGISYEEAQELVEANDTGGFYRREMPKEKKSIELPEFYIPLNEKIDEDNKRYWDYLTRVRGLPIGTILDYNLGYCGFGKFSQRVVVPVFWDGVLVNWVARAVVSDSVIRNLGIRKLLTPEFNNQSRYLFNLDKLWGKETIVLVEGPFDMLKIPDMAVASFGKRLHDAQQLLLKKSGCKHVIIAYDNDAQEETYKTARRLSEMFRVSIVDIPTGEDPGSLDPAKTMSLIYEAKPFERRKPVWR